jgi:hypothetical protein
VQNVLDVHFSNKQPAIWAVQLYLHSVKEFAIFFHWPKADVDIKVFKGQLSELHTHSPLIKVEFTPHEKQLDRFEGVQFWQIS